MIDRVGPRYSDQLIRLRINGGIEETLLHQGSGLQYRFVPRLRKRLDALKRDANVFARNISSQIVYKPASLLLTK
jgi:hypothetical protein